MNYVNIHGTKGGVGATTIAVALAVLASQQVAVGDHVNLHDSLGSSDDIRSTLGLSDSAAALSDRLTIGKGGAIEYDGADIPAGLVALIADRSHSRAPLHLCRRRESQTDILVVRNDYLSLRSALRITQERRADKYVIVHEEGRALDVSDVVAVLDLAPTEYLALPYDASVSRAIDAGLLGTRLPKVLAPLATILPSFAPVDS